MENRRKVNLPVISEGHVLNHAQRESLNLSFTAQEIKDTLWNILDDKAPGLDGYNSKFYKAAWSIV